jgi:hypothetical protein
VVAEAVVAAVLRQQVRRREDVEARRRQLLQLDHPRRDSAT